MKARSRGGQARSVAPKTLASASLGMKARSRGGLKNPVTNLDDASAPLGLDLCMFDTQNSHVEVVVPLRGGHRSVVTQSPSVSASLRLDRCHVDTHSSNVETIVPRLIAYGRIRRQLVSFATRATLQLKAIERMGQAPKLASTNLAMPAPPISMAGLPIARASALVRPERLATERQIVKLAKQLPVWAWVESVPGCGALGLGLIVCETGDLAQYANPAKVWKRLGLAVFDGRAQRRVTDAAEAERQGYNPKRRSLMHNVGESLLKQNGKSGYYRTLYDERKAYETAQHPDLPLIHRHKRALRYMEKRFLLHLWQAWRREAIGIPEPIESMPLAASIGREVVA